MNSVRQASIRYLISHESPDDFKIGEQVFLKNAGSSITLTVVGLGKKDVFCEQISDDGKKKIISVKPGDILQFLYAGIIVMGGRHMVSLN